MLSPFRRPPVLISTHFIAHPVRNVFHASNAHHATGARSDLHAFPNKMRTSVSRVTMAGGDHARRLGKNAAVSRLRASPETTWWEKHLITTPQAHAAFPGISARRRTPPFHLHHRPTMKVFLAVAQDLHQQFAAAGSSPSVTKLSKGLMCRRAPAMARCSRASPRTDA
jgi:hypothetical protein